MQVFAKNLSLKIGNTIFVADFQHLFLTKIKKNVIIPLTGLPQKGGENMATIHVEDSENLEKAIKRFKRMVEKEGIIREWKKREYYEKPSTILNRKNKALARKLMKKTRGKGGHTSAAY